MKIVILFVVGILALSACSEKKVNLSEKDYKRSNAVSEKAFNKLDRE